MRLRAVRDEPTRSHQEPELQVEELRARNDLFLTQLKARREERVAWDLLLIALATTPELLVGSCLYCGHLRTLDRAWRAAAAEFREALVQQQRLSHTFCPDCIRDRGLG